jgi:flagellar basal body rod protein FlgG
MIKRDAVKSREVVFVLILGILASATVGMLLPAALATRRSNAAPVPYTGVQGALGYTGVDTDVAIQGQGFLAVRLPSNQIAYTRHGELVVNNQNHLVVAVGQGYELVPSITLPPGSANLVISALGSLTVSTPGSSTATKVGQLSLTCFQNPRSLHPAGQGLYLETNASGPGILATTDTNTGPQFLQRYLEADAAPSGSMRQDAPQDAVTFPDLKDERSQ